MSEKDLEEYLAGLKPNNCDKLFPKMTDEQITNMIDGVIKQYMGQPVSEEEREEIEAKQLKYYKDRNKTPAEYFLQAE